MTETLVHVSTLEEWKSVLDIWFKQGYAWIDGTKEYVGRIFENGGRFLSLVDDITYSFSVDNPSARPFIEYSDFMAQREKTMTEKIVHVTTLKQWKAVLDVWFKQGYEWYSGEPGYRENYFDAGKRGLALSEGNKILTANVELHDCIEYSDFMAQQKEGNKMKTYYVTREQLDLIEELKSLPNPLVAIMQKKYEMETLYNELPAVSDREWLRYLGGDETIEFKVKETLYRLWRIDKEHDKVYMWLTPAGNPDWTINEDLAFTAPLEEIKKHKTISWEIEEVK